MRSTSHVLRSLSKNCKLYLNGSFLQPVQSYCSGYKLLNFQNSNYPAIRSCRCVSIDSSKSTDLSKSPGSSKSTDSSKFTNLSNVVLIYEGPAKLKIFTLKFVSLSTSGFAILLQYVIFTQNTLSDMAKYGWSILTMVSLLTPVLGHFLFRKYVMNMYYNPDNETYIAVTLNFFGTKNCLTFTPADVQTLGFEVVSTVKVKGRALFFDPNHFTNIEHYKKIMKYDKPIDFGEDFGKKEFEEKKS